MTEAFPHRWHARILPARPLILPSRHFIYPRDAEEVERGALELMITPAQAPSPVAASAPAQNHPGSLPFLATCALGFRDPHAPTGIWSAPHPDMLCAVSGGYAYMIDTLDPQHFTMLPYRPVFAVVPAIESGLLLFAGSRSVLAWGRDGQAWESERLSDEGLTLGTIDAGILHGRGWHLMTDRETSFALDLRNGRLLPDDRS